MSDGNLEKTHKTKKKRASGKRSLLKSEKALRRQTIIFTRLNAGQTVNVKELAEEFKVGVRTIQKDLNERLKMVYDIVDLGHGNYAFAEGYRLKSTEDEEAKIAVSLMKSLQHGAVPELDDFIDAAIPTTTKYEKMFLFDLNFEPIGDIGNFRVILQSIAWKVALEFLYTDKDGNKKEVTAYPYRIANFKNYWYLVAYDVADEKIKTYYLKRIEKLHTHYENFDVDEELQEQIERQCDTIDSPWYGKGDAQVTLRVVGDARRYLRRNLPPNMQMLEQSDDHDLIRLHYHDETEALSLVKHWLPDIEIADDPRLQARLEETLRTYLNRKKSD